MSSQYSAKLSSFSLMPNFTKYLYSKESNEVENLPCRGRDGGHRTLKHWVARSHKPAKPGFARNRLNNLLAPDWQVVWPLGLFRRTGNLTRWVGSFYSGPSPVSVLEPDRETAAKLLKEYVRNVKPLTLLKVRSFTCDLTYLALILIHGNL